MSVTSEKPNELDPPQYPAGPFVPLRNYSSEHRQLLIAAIGATSAILRKAVSGLSDEQLDTRYRNWTIRQIVHHLADSHVNCYIRFKWTLTEEQPTIKAYDEGRWAALADSRTGDIAAPLALLEGLHGRWVQLMNSMIEGQFQRSFVHPETGKTVSLNEALCYYAWHCMHHTGQIAWLRKSKSW